MIKIYDNGDDVSAGTLLNEAEKENGNWAKANQKYLDDLVVISKWCQTLQHEGPPITHVEVTKNGKLVDISILEIKQLVEKYSKI